jgi:hypothetical protein
VRDNLSILRLAQEIAICPKGNLASVRIATSASQNNVDRPVCAPRNDRYKVILRRTKSLFKESIAIDTPIPLKRANFLYLFGRVLAPRCGEISFALPRTLRTHKPIVGRKGITNRHAPDWASTIADYVVSVL